MKNIHNFNYDLSTDDRVRKNGHKPCVIWMTGLSGSGKSTIANALCRSLFDLGLQISVLDGDNVRSGLNSDLGFSEEDRTENIRRISHVADIMSQTGQIVICCFISPREKDRSYARFVCKSKFFEVHVSTPLDVCEKRDPKGLYKKARDGKIPHFTGVSDVFEEPKNPDISLNTNELEIEDSVSKVIELLKSTDIISNALTDQPNNEKTKKIAVDFDGVIHSYSKGFCGLLNAYDLPHVGALDALKTLNGWGYKIVVFSSRPSYVIEDWLKRHEMMHLVSEVTNVKVAAAYYIDDHALEFEKGNPKSWDNVLKKIGEKR